MRIGWEVAAVPLRVSSLRTTPRRRTVLSCGRNDLGRSHAHKGRTVQRENCLLSRRVRRAVAVACIVLGVAACSSGSGSGAASTSSTVATTSFNTTSTSTPTSSSTSAPPPSTTTTIADPAMVAEADVRAAIALAQETFSACLVAMPACDPSTLAVARAGDLLARNTARINEWNAAGYTVRDRDKFRYVVESVAVQPDGKRATAMVCIADGSKLVKPGAGPGGVDVIIDDAYTSGRESWDMRLDPDGKWRAYDAPAVGPTEARDVCPAG